MIRVRYDAHFAAGRSPRLHSGQGRPPDAEGDYTYVNAAAKHILGFDPTELVGTNAFEYVHSEDITHVRTAFEQTITADSFTETAVRYRHRTDDGAYVWLASRMSNVTDQAIDGYVVSSRDISDRVAAERERWEVTERFHELASATDDVLWMFDQGWTEVLFVNPAFEAVYRESKASASGLDPEGEADT
nr:PAS domain-containing protein [Halobellus inordinatus]